MSAYCLLVYFNGILVLVHTFFSTQLPHSYWPSSSHPVLITSSFPLFPPHLTLFFIFLFIFCHKVKRLQDAANYATLSAHTHTSQHASATSVLPARGLRTRIHNRKIIPASLDSLYEVVNLHAKGGCRSRHSVTHCNYVLILTLHDQLCNFTYIYEHH